MASRAALDAPGGVPDPPFLSRDAAVAAVCHGFAGRACADFVSSSYDASYDASNVVHFTTDALLSETEQRAFTDFLNRFVTDDFRADPFLQVPASIPQDMVPDHVVADLSAWVVPLGMASPGDATHRVEACVPRVPWLDADGAGRLAAPRPSDPPGEQPASGGSRGKLGGTTTTTAAVSAANSAAELGTAVEAITNAKPVSKRKKGPLSSVVPPTKERNVGGRRKTDAKLAATAADGTSAGDVPVISGNIDNYGGPPKGASSTGQCGRRSRRASKLKSAKISSGASLHISSPILGGGPRGLKPIVVPGTRPGRRGAKGHDLLTESERKANHIASEQRRRQNIRIGFDTLCNLVPTLSQCHRSETLILQKSIDYIRNLLEAKSRMKERIRALRELLGDVPEPGDDSGSEDGGLDVSEY